MQNLNDKYERQNFILHQLKVWQKVDYASLSSTMGISEDTVRRDINDLVRKGLVRKIKGGALPKSILPISFHERESFGTPEKNIIAGKACNLFHSGQVVVFDGGTTPFLVAASLPHDLSLTVITHSFPVANLFLDAPNIRTIFIGGAISQNSLITTGIKTHEEYSRLHADICVLGVHSFHHEQGITDPIYEEAMVKEVICHISDEVVAVTSSSKLNRVSTHHVCNTEDVSMLVTERSPNEPFPDKEKYTSQNVHIL